MLDVDPDVAVVVAVVGEVVDVVVLVELVVVVVDESVPVPCSEMAKLSLSTSIVVELVHGPGAVGVNVYVNWHDCPPESATPAQFCEPPKLVGSFGAPPA